SVAHRTGEIGVRMALGAKRGGVLRMILSEALVLLAAGLVPGAIGLVIAARFVEKMLYGVSAFDPIRLPAIKAVFAFGRLHFRSNQARRHYSGACLRRDCRQLVASFARRIHRPDSGTARRVVLP